MASERTIQLSFAGGEIAPDMYGRRDDVKYQNGLQRCRNFICLPQGPVKNRPGFEFVNEAGNGDRPVRLIPFAYSAGQTMIIELGHKYARFHSYGATLVNDDGTPYQVATPWESEDLFTLNYVQSGDIVTVTHEEYPPYEIRRYGGRDWRVVAVQVNTKLTAPTGVAAVRATAAAEDSNASKYTQKYRVSCLNADKTEESEASGVVSVVANLYAYGTTVKISCDTMPNAAFYRFYKNKGGLYGYIGDSETPEIFDDNITPKTDVTIRRFDNVFSEGNGIKVATVTNGGSGYGTVDRGLSPLENLSYVWKLPSGYPSLSVTLTDAGNTGYGGKVEAVIERYVENGYYYTKLTGIKVTSVGGRYTKPTVTVSGSNYRKLRFSSKTATKTVTLNLTVVSTLPTVEVSDSTGTGASLRAVVTDGKVTGIEIRAAGSDYTSPTVKISGGSGTGATATASVGDAGDYPRAVGYFEQRRIFAGLHTDPQRVIMTRTGSESDFSYSLPYRDDDRVSFQMASREYSAVRHVVSLTSLILLTSSMAYRVTASGGITPANVQVMPQSNTGASEVMPQVVGNSVIYCAARGGHVRDFAYEYSAGGFVSNDLCLRANHLFDFKTVLDSALTLAPLPILWYVSSDGGLLGLTYIPEQEVAAWHKHTTDGVFESVAAVAEGEEDHLYVVVRREINGQQKRYIERMTSMNIENLNSAFFVDAGGAYDGAETQKVSGLDWLEGKTVSILANGCVMPQQVVKDGAITLDMPATHVVVGLPYESDAQTMPLAMQNAAAFGGGVKKNITRVALQVKSSSGVFCGPDFYALTEYKQRTDEPMGEPPDLKTEEIDLRIAPVWQTEGSVCIRQSDPLPLELQSVVLTVAT